MIYVKSIKNMGGYDSNGKRFIIVHLECDSETDLPAPNYFDSADCVIGQSSTAHIISTNARFQMQSDGTWTLQQAGTATYTKTEIDTMLNAKQNVLTFDNTPTANSQNPVYSGGVFSAISGFISMNDILGQGVAIVSTATNPGNLNDYKTPGKYYGQNAVTNSLLNLPIANTNTHIGLIVTKMTDSNIIQLVKFGGVAYDKFWYWRRYAVSTDTWQPWYYLEGTQV